MSEENLHPELFVPPPFYGTGEMLTWSVHTLLESLDKKKLFSDYQHATKKFENSADSNTEEEVHALCNALEIEMITDSLVDARGYYSFYPVIVDNDELVLLDPNDFHTEIVSLRFPPPVTDNEPCITACFRPEMDVLPVQTATLGPFIDQKLLQAKDSERAMIHALCKGFCDALMNKIDHEIRRALLLPREQGRRFSVDGPNMPSAEQQQALLDSTCAEDRLGLSLSTQNSLQPEFSMMSIFIPALQQKKQNDL